jgi:hypothetical protein
MATNFYQAAAVVSFLLLLLWWVVLSARYEQWVYDPLRRAEAWAVSNFFLLPGIMCLVSLLAIGSSTLWRVGFASAGVFGMAQSGLFVANENKRPTQAGAVYAAVGISFVLYGVIVLIAADREIAGDVVGLTPLETEGIAVAGLLLVGVQLAWLAFARRPDVPAG